MFAIWRCVLMYLSCCWKVNTEQRTCTLLRNSQGLNLKKKQGQGSLDKWISFAGWLIKSGLFENAALGWIVFILENIITNIYGNCIYLELFWVFSWQELKSTSFNRQNVRAYVSITTVNGWCLCVCRFFRLWYVSVGTVSVWESVSVFASTTALQRAPGLS